MQINRDRKANWIYWITTSIIALLAIAGGLGDLLMTEQAMEVFRHLGYPDYFAVLLGAAKILGVVAILAPVPRTLREWAYAGFTFDICAAIISILAVGDPFYNITIPVIGLVLTLTSYVLWRRRSYTVST